METVLLTCQFYLIDVSRDEQYDDINCELIKNLSTIRDFSVSTEVAMTYISMVVSSQGCNQ